MARVSTRENKNIYQLTRENLKLTRETASELLESIPPERIEKIENERSFPHPDEVLTMAEKYKKMDIGVSEDAMLKMLWDLLQCVVEQDKIRVHFKDKRKIELSPVFLWMYQDKIYLFAYEKKTLNVYSLHEIDWFTLLGSKYPRELQEKFYKVSCEQIHKRIKNMEESKEEE